MCGIYATFLLTDQAKTAGQRALAGLKRLEYRGYDSWGVSVLNNDILVTDKHAGKISGVEKLSLPDAQIALGHTRWATHGGVTDVNAHPHLASDGSFALVQNGVMENYQEIKKMLMEEGYDFISQTDTEVIVHLLEKVAKPGDGKPLSFTDLSQAFRQLTGRNTVGVLTKEGAVFAIRDGSPLVIARDELGNWFLSSDVVSVAEDATHYYALESGEGVAIENGKVLLFDVNTNEEKKLQLQPIDVQSMKLDKSGFDHFMLKEIHEQAEVLHRPLEQKDELYAELLFKLRAARNVYTVGAGSADFVSGEIAFLLRQQGISATAVKSYEARAYRSLVSSEDVCIAVSQSGETADTIEVIEWMKEKGVTIVSIVNMPGSTLTRLSDLPFMLQIGPEIGIASTKAVSSMMTWGISVAQQLAGLSLEDLKKEVKTYEAELSFWLKDEIVQKQLHGLAKELIKRRDVFLLGRGQLYMPTLESALKLKEISYIHAEGFSGGELKHGVIALIEEGTPVFCLIAEDDEKADMLNAAAEVSARGARVIGIAAEQNQLFETWIRVPSHPLFAPISSFLPAQLLTYFMALEKGLDPDKPRNLAKSVTVK
jgi:glutamine---fructose-6-phosphate transaminase (isomerizing)